MQATRQAALPAAPPATLDAALIRRHDRAGPRYTSYPTAVQFDARFQSLDYRAAAARSNAAPGASLSLYVHLPFCANPCFYCGCTKIITRQRHVAEAYLIRLEREIELQSALFPRARRVEQLHFGGGTPTFYSIDDLSCLMGTLGRHFNLGDAGDREFSIEIDPRTVTPAKLHELAALGFNRASIGVQDFDPAVQAAVNREQSPTETLRLIDAARSAGFGSLSVDLIYGLPRQTLASFARTLDQVIAAQPQRIAAYSYAHLPGRFKPQQRIRSEELPAPEVKLALLQLTVEKLLAAGYVYIGMDHFALPQDELARALHDGTLQRNFQGYSTRGGLDLVGLGMSAIGRMDDSYAQNARTLSTYYAALDAGQLPIERGIRLSSEDRLRREVIEAIMCRDGVDIAAVERRHAIDFAGHFAAELDALRGLAADGLVTVDAQRIAVTPPGRYLLRAIAMCFDAYLPAAAAPAPVGERPLFSRVV
jgi:oxygen-independent coproporphyrinogen-3 oxidase